jgi:hypothetical protein
VCFALPRLESEAGVRLERAVKKALQEQAAKHSDEISRLLARWAACLGPQWRRNQHDPLFVYSMAHCLCILWPNDSKISSLSGSAEV